MLLVVNIAKEFLGTAVVELSVHSLPVLGVGEVFAQQLSNFLTWDPQ